MTGRSRGPGTVGVMETRLRPALVLSIWTVFVWTTRVRNIWTDDSLTTGGQLWRTAIAVTFTVFAVVTFVAWVRARGERGATSRTAMWIRAFAVWTLGVWVVRGAQIAVADHTVAFKVVHAALAAVSVGLALWADREAHRTSRSQPVNA